MFQVGPIWGGGKEGGLVLIVMTLTQCHLGGLVAIGVTMDLSAREAVILINLSIHPRTFKNFVPGEMAPQRLQQL